MVESEFILLGTDRDSGGIPWALLASDRDGPQALKSDLEGTDSSIGGRQAAGARVEARHGSVASA